MGFLIIELSNLRLDADADFGRVDLVPEPLAAVLGVPGIGVGAMLRFYSLQFIYATRM